MESQGEVGGIQIRIIQESLGANSARVYFINFHPLRMDDEVTTKYYRYTRGQISGPLWRKSAQRRYEEKREMER